MKAVAIVGVAVALVFVALIGVGALDENQLEQPEIIQGESQGESLSAQPSSGIYSPQPTDTIQP